MRPALSISSSKGLRRGVSILVLAALVLSGTLFCGRVLRLERGERTRDFFAEDAAYDVLFYGSSHVINGIYPMYLWEQYGIPSFNLAGHGCRPSMAYWLLKMTLPYHKPKAAVLDVLFCWEESSELTPSLAHKLLDLFPASVTKTRAVLDLYSQTADRAELLFPLDVYHNRWKELDAAMVENALGEPETLTGKGAETRPYVQPAEDYTLIDRTELVEDFPREMEYVMKFIALCQENDIVPVITYLPCDISVWSQLCCNRAMAMAEEAGALTLNLQYENPLDPLTDWSDGADHVNPSGAMKLTDAVGALLREQLDLPDRRQEEAYQSWAADWAAYLQTQEESMQSADTPERVLTLAALPGFTAALEVAQDYVPGAVLQAQMAQLGDRGRTVAWVDAPEEAVLRLTVRDAEGQQVLCRTYGRTLLEGGNP